jgi:hypothetical protein
MMSTNSAGPRRGAQPLMVQGAAYGKQDKVPLLTKPAISMS